MERIATTWQEAIQAFDRAEHAQAERDRSNGLFYSLDDETIRDRLESHCMDARQTPYRALVRREARRILREGMDELSASQRQRIYLHFWEGESYCEIARAEGVDESAVRRSIQRGLAQLKKHLSGTGITTADFALRVPTHYVKHTRRKKTETIRQPNPTSIIEFV